MSQCTKRGCRNLKTICEDCGRTTCSAKLRYEEDPLEWKDLDKFPPPENEPCEYKIMVTCRGWYRGKSEIDHVFASDETKAPTAKMMSWRKWQDGPTFEEGFKIVRKHREKIQKELSDNGKPDARSN